MVDKSHLSLFLGKVKDDPLLPVNHLNVVLGRKIFYNNCLFTGNLSGRIMHYRSKKKSDFSEKSKINKNQGLMTPDIQFDEEFVDSFRQKVDAIFNSGDYTYAKEEEGSITEYQIRSPDFDFEHELPEIEQFITEEVQEWLKDYYGCYARPVFLNVAKNLHSPKEMAEMGSLNTKTWHMDPYSSDLIRMFVLLEDTDENCGPTEVIDREDSIFLMEKNNYKKMKYGEEELKDVNIEKFTGTKGDVSFLHIGKCLHRAGNPDPGEERYMIRIAFLPYYKPLPDNWLESSEYELKGEWSRIGYRRLFEN